MLETELIPAEEAGAGHLMIVLHGLGDSMEGYRFLPAVLKLPWMNYLLVNAPDDYYGGYKWFDFPSDNMAPEIARSRELLFNLLDDQCEREFRPERMFMFGFSQGCLMSVEIGMRYPSKFAGIVGISGWAHDTGELLSKQSDTAREQKFLITHGTHDPLLPYSMAKSRFDELIAGGMDIEWHSFPKEHSIHGEQEIAVIRDFVNRCR